MARVLIVDDVPDITHMMALLLTLRGHHTSEAHNGAQAMALIQQVPFDAYLIDIRLPDMSGLEVARYVRKVRGETPRILAITGWGHREMRRRCLESGFDYHVVKPVDGMRVIGLIEHVKS